MPRVIADSDDDGDEPYHEEEIDYRGNPINSGSNKQPSWTTVTDIAPLDIGATGTAQTHSTGSTERLQQQIRRAERALIAPSPEVVLPAMALPAGSSAGGAGSKRRHSATALSVPGSPPVNEAPGRVKRTKTTLVTYSKIHRSSAQSGDGDENIRFSDHSATGLPSGSIVADFVNHEPDVMFCDTGSTAVDGSSSQVRMLQQALRSLPESGASTSLQVPEAMVGSSMVEGSSSFPWSASQATPAVEKTAAIDDGVRDAVAEGQAMQLGGEVAPAALFGVEDHASGRITDAPAEQPKPASLEQIALEPEIPVLPTMPPRSSPRVEITVARVQAPSVNADDPASLEKPAKSRRRKSKRDAADKLSSEGKLIGLPKEQYMPRPSKRRATEVIEPVDFSIVPEKAAKAKRRKTVDAAQLQGSQPPVERAQSAGAQRKAFEPGPTEEIVLEPPLASKISSRAAKTVHTKSQQSEEQQKAPPAIQSAPKISQSPLKGSQEDAIFLKLAPKAKSASRVKRSVTTIFEDHVCSPSLSQQQEKRRAALEDISSDVKLGSQRKRRMIGDEDEENEAGNEVPTAEIAKPPESVVQSLPPKKRGRGGPPKAAAPTKTHKSAEKVGEEEDAPALETAGKPASGHARSEEVAPHEQSEAPKETSLHDSAREKTAAVHAKQSETIKPPARGTQEPTPSPEKQALKAATTPAKSSPTTHSPLKSNPRAPFRVGLSRRHRIPSLLRTMRPPAKR